MRITPITWPGAPRPGGSTSPARTFYVIYKGREMALPRGELAIGRSASCEVRLDDMLVSRRHARFLVSSEALFIEDLGSANGVYVNERRIEGPTPLKHGDRLLLGMQELGVMELHVNRDGPARAAKPPESMPTMPDLESEVDTERVDAPNPSSSSGSPRFNSETEKSDGFGTIARLADRMLALGRVDAAVRILSTHLRELLESARAGQPLPANVLSTAGVYALKLAQATHEGGWIDLAVELHMVSKRPLPEKCIAQVEALAELLEDADWELFAFYVEVLRSQRGQLSAAEQALVQRLIDFRIPGT